jgi:hypothetical protein
MSKPPVADCTLKLLLEKPDGELPTRKRHIRNPNANAKDEGKQEKGT